jgi:hypothetical protein
MVFSTIFRLHSENQHGKPFKDESFLHHLRTWMPEQASTGEFRFLKAIV